MSSWNLLFEVTVLIICMLHQLISVANSGCNVYANTLWMLHLFVRTVASPSLYFLSDILASILIPDYFVAAPVLVSKILK